MQLPDQSSEHVQEADSHVQAAGLLERCARFRALLAPLILMAAETSHVEAHDATPHHQEQLADKGMELKALIDINNAVVAKIKDVDTEIDSYEKKLRECDDLTSKKMDSLKKEMDALLIKHLKEDDVKELHKQYTILHRTNAAMEFKAGFAAIIAEKAKEEIEKKIKTIESTMPIEALQNFEGLQREWDECIADKEGYYEDINVFLSPLRKKRKALMDRYDKLQKILLDRSTEAIV